MTEHQIQCALIQWFRAQHPRHAGMFFSIPNGANVKPHSRQRLVAEGLTAGVSDLFLAVPVHPYHGMFVEVKTPSGRLSGVQREFLHLADLGGYSAKVVYGLDEAISAVERYLSGDF